MPQYGAVAAVGLAVAEVADAGVTAVTASVGTATARAASVRVTRRRVRRAVVRVPSSATCVLRTVAIVLASLGSTRRTARRVHPDHALHACAVVGRRPIAVQLSPTGWRTSRSSQVHTHTSFPSTSASTQNDRA